MIVQGIEGLSPVEGRGNTLHLDRGIRLIDDSYNASPSSVMAALDSLKHARPPRTAVLADMLELGDDGPDYHREVGRHLQIWVLSALSLWASYQRTSQITASLTLCTLPIPISYWPIAPSFFRTKRFWLRGPAVCS